MANFQTVTKVGKMNLVKTVVAVCAVILFACLMMGCKLVAIHANFSEQ